MYMHMTTTTCTVIQTHTHTHTHTHSQNACHQRMSNAAAESTERAQGCKPPQGIKTRSYYTGRGLNKGL